MNGRIQILSLVLIVIVFAAACSPGGATAPAPQSESQSEPHPTIAADSPATSDGPTGAIVIGVAADAECWNPIEGPCGKSLHYHDLIMERLLTLDRNNQLASGLAVSWKTIDDLTWEFELRKGVQFANGEPFNAEAVVFMFDTILNPDGRDAPPTMRGNYRLLERIEVVDDYTVRFHTAKPFPLLAQYMTYEPRAVPPKYYTQVGKDEFGLKPIGTGPYTLVEWVKNDHFTLEARPDYWGPKPAIQRLTFRPIPEETTRLAELLAGGADIIEDVPQDLAAELDKSQNVHKVTVESLRTLVVNLRPEDRLQDKALREAFMYATDIDTIINEVLGGYGDKLGRGNPVTAHEFGYDPSIPEWPHDVEMARQKVKESGYDGRNIELWYPEADVPGIDKVAEVLQAQWAAAGVNVSIHQQEDGLWRKNWSARTIPGDIFLKSSVAKAMDSDGRLVPNGHCYDPDRGLGRVSFFCDPEIDKLIEESQVTMDREKRQELLAEAWRKHRDAAHYVALYSPRFIHGVSNKLEWQPTVEGLWSSLVEARWK